ncbi:glutathione-disulfide reductase [Sphingorhabdus sp. Alg239-R122]|uniref:glutathione-disulfide reductase n=1 Tax=Sphingorhabdus sp. Alg239-R122 TaxID=2305989 RepID=UPI0013DBCFAA|nr:glutathione-disulfide reductase [Sphingorhabdus sp. Alg239-R122]
MSEYDYDLFVIGAGSGGVRASRIAASHGAKVALAEEYRVGGTCVIRGCVPKKMLVYGAHFAEDLHEAARFGWDVNDPKFVWQRLRDIVQTDIDRLEGLYGNTLSSHNVKLFEERATVAGPNEVKLASGQVVTAGKILIATGGWPVPAQCEGAEHALTSNEIFHLEQVPGRLLVVGGGYIANEFAGIFHAFGSDVTILNRSDVLLRSYDQEIVARLVELSKEKGINFHFKASLQKIEKQADGSLHVGFNDGTNADYDTILVATGRAPNSAGLGLEEVGVKLDKSGAVIVDEYNQSSVPSIYAVGDVTNRVQLTPVAIREGHAFADTVFDNNPRIVDYDAIPSAVFASPPIASVGLTEAEASAKYGDDIKIYRSDFRPMKNVVSGREERGLYKMITAGSDEKVIGLHLIGPESSEIIQGAAVAVKAGLSKQAFDDTVALHPSMAEELVLLK